MGIIIQLLNNYNQVTHIHKFHQRTVHIGRSYDNDLTLLDPHVCAKHAALMVDEGSRWWLHDLNSVNGTLNGRGDPIQAVTLPDEGYSFTVGRQRLKVILGSTVVAPTQPIAKDWRSSQVLTSLIFLLFCLVLISLDFAYDAWLGAVGEDIETWYKQLIIVPLVLVALLVPPALLALWARVRSLDTHFRQQINLVFLTLTGWLLWVRVIHWLEFNYRDGLVLTIGSESVFALLLFSFFWCSFTLAGIKRRATKLCLAVLLASTYWLVPYGFSEENHMETSYQGVLLPRGFLISTPQSESNFLYDTEQLFEEVKE